MSRVITRFSAGLVQAYDFSTGPVTASNVLPTAVFPIGAADLTPDSCAVAPDLSRALYATPNQVTSINRDGTILWQLDFEPASSARPNAHNRCDYSLDGTVVWIYRPDAMARNGSGLDTWLAVDADTGRILAQTDLGSAGHGGEHIAHPDGKHMLLDVGEGQDGTRVYRGRLDGDRIDLVEYQWGNRVLLSVNSDGSRLMTVDHDNTDAAFHTYLDGAVVARLPIEALGHEPFDAFIEYAGGYLNDSTAVITLAGETDDEQEWFERYLVDPHAGNILGRLDAPSTGQYDFEPLGDGSWLSTTDNGQPKRHTLKP